MPGRGDLVVAVPVDPFEAVLTEAMQLAAQGVKEITLLGQNVNAYRVVFEGIEADLAMLIETIAEIPQIPGALAYGDTQEEAAANAEASALRTLADQIESSGKTEVLTFAAY